MLRFRAWDSDLSVPPVLRFDLITVDTIFVLFFPSPSRYCNARLAAKSRL